MIEVKVCGLTRREDIEAAAEAGADYAGIQIGGASARALGIDQAAELADLADSLGLKAVAVMINPDQKALEALAQAQAFRFLQLNGAETPAQAEHAAEVTRLRVIKTLSAATPQELDRRNDYEAVHAFIFNPKGEFGVLRAARAARPWFLAGGLTPENVAGAIHASGALMVDVSTGVETGTGKKDEALIRAFVEAAQEGE